MPSPDHSPFVWILSTPPYIRTEPKFTASEALTSELDSHSQPHRCPPSPKSTHTDEPEPTLPQTSPHPSRQHLSSYRPPCPTPLCCMTPSEEFSATPTLGTLAQALTLTQAAMASSPPLSHTEAVCQAFNSCCCQTPESVCLSTCLVPSLHIHGCFCPISTSCTQEAAHTQSPPLSFRTLSTCTDSLKQSPQRGPFGLTSLFLPLHRTATTTRHVRHSWSLLPLPRSSQAPPLSRSACSGSSPALSHPLSSHACISTSADCQSRAGGDCVLFYR